MSMWTQAIGTPPPGPFDYRGYGSDIAEDGTETLCEATVVDGVSFLRFVVLSGETR